MDEDGDKIDDSITDENGNIKPLYNGHKKKIAQLEAWYEQNINIGGYRDKQHGDTVKIHGKKTTRPRRKVISAKWVTEVQGSGS